MYKRVVIMLICIVFDSQVSSFCCIVAVLRLAQDGEWKAGHGHGENGHFLKPQLQRLQRRLQRPSGSAVAVAPR